MLLYVNTFTLVFIELNSSDVKLMTAFDDYLMNCKREIPRYSLRAPSVLSNAIETKAGSFTGECEHFFNWLRVEDEKEKFDQKQTGRKA